MSGDHFVGAEKAKLYGMCVSRRGGDVGVAHLRPVDYGLPQSGTKEIRKDDSSNSTLSMGRGGGKWPKENIGRGALFPIARGKLEARFSL